MSATSMSAQDLLARHAPVDRKMKTVDTLALRDLLIKELAQSPSADLYEDWNNQYAHRATALPDSFTIQLSNFCMPTPSRVVTSNFGARWGRMHKGLDVKVYIGDTIRSAFNGKVRIVRYEPAGYGKYIVIRHNNGLETIYGHLSKQLVVENQEVRAGEVIGLGGNTGRSTGSHLHFETRLCGVALNPAVFFDFRNQDVTGDYYVFTKRNYEKDAREATRMPPHAMQRMLCAAAVPSSITRWPKARHSIPSHVSAAPRLKPSASSTALARIRMCVLDKC